mmetsp:Transcript_25122/g.68241  ORF Transcript_25122/g.68241 Transcript_25122/m.68241 type:complete len:622 (-) Transcript_25122:372-2237(-)
MVEVCTRKKSYCSDECNTEQPQQESNELCLSQRAAWWNELRDSRERTFVSNRGGGLLNSLVNLSLKGCSQLHRTDVVLRKGCTTGLRVSPRGPLPLPGKVRRATSYAGSSSGSSPQRSNTTAASLCSLDAANQPQQPVPAGRAAAGTAGTAARAQSPAADASTKVSHGRSCSYSSGSSAVGGMGGDSSHGSSPPSSVGTAYEANRAASSKITLLEDPCDMRFWSVPSMPPRSFSDRTTGGQGQWKGGSGLNAGSPPPMVTERLAFGVSTAIGVRSTMEDFAFALPLAHPSGVDSELLQAACFGVFDGHGGAEVAQSLAEHVPGRIQENVHQIIEFGPQHIAEVLMGHESLLRRLTEPWIVESSQADTTSPCAPNLISPCPVVWEEEHLGRRMHAQTMGRQQQQQEQQMQDGPGQQQQQQQLQQEQGQQHSYRYPQQHLYPAKAPPPPHHPHRWPAPHAPHMVRPPHNPHQPHPRYHQQQQQQSLQGNGDGGTWTGQLWVKNAKGSELVCSVSLAGKGLQRVNQIRIVEYFQRAKLETVLQCSSPIPVTAIPNKQDAKKLEELCGYMAGHRGKHLFQSAEKGALAELYCVHGSTKQILRKAYLAVPNASQSIAEGLSCWFIG